MGSVAEGHFLGVFASTPGNDACFFDFYFLGVHAGSFVRAIAKGLAF
jgi:hypothetical protein